MPDWIQDMDPYFQAQVARKWEETRAPEMETDTAELIRTDRRVPDMVGHGIRERVR